MNTRNHALPVVAGSILAGLFLIQSAAVDAQQGAGMQGRAMAMGTNPLFAERAPEIGEPLPDITIVDDQGNPVNMRELASENYTVLVLGCLT